MSPATTSAEQHPGAAGTAAVAQAALPVDSGPRLVLARAFLWATAAGCACGALLMLLTLDDSRRWMPAAAFFLLGSFALLALRLPPARLRLGLSALQIALMLLFMLCAWFFGWALGTPALALTGLMICVLTAAAGWTAGIALALATVSGVLVLHVLSTSTGLAPNPAPPLLVLGGQIVAIVAGLAGGMRISRLLARGMQAAESREQRFRRLLALSVDGYWEIDAQYRLRAITGRSPDTEALTSSRGLGRVPWELPQWQCDPETQDVLLVDLDARLPFREIPVRLSLPDGNLRHLLISGEPRHDKRGIFTGYWGVVRDVTAQEEAQEALQATQTRYRELFSRIPTPLLLHRSGRVIEANAAALALFGQPDLKSFAECDLLDSYEAGDSRERARQRMDMLHGQPLGTALPVTDFTLVMGPRKLSVRATSVRVDAQGGPATLAIYVDDTERLAAEGAVRRSEATLSTLVATSPDLITLTDMDSGRYAMVNRSFERITGFSAAEAIGRSALELGLWQDEASRTAFMQHLREHGSVTDWPVDVVSKSGARYTMVASASRFLMDERDYMVVNARDVSDKERERLEREAILANASIGIALTRQQRFVLVNRHFEQLFGWSEGELHEQPSPSIWRDPQEQTEVARLIRATLDQGGSLDIERAVRRKDGSTFTARIRGRSIDPHRPADSGYVWIVEDITERREFEQALARARDEAEAANRAKSAFLANTSHELRTPLNGLIGLSRLARDEGLTPERRRQYLEQIELSSQSLSGIISDILDLSRIEAGKLPIESAPFDLGAELKTLHRTYAVLAELRGLSLRIEVGPEFAQPVRGDALRVRQIVSNFLVNAIKFTAAGSVCLRARRLGGAQPAVVRLEVQDSGAGIAPETLARLFRPFTQADDSTTRRFGGTGLGLSICRELAALMGGQVGAISRLGQGSTFWAELPLPATAADVPRADGSAGVGGVQGGRSLPGARVLMAEDNAVNMMIAVAMLERWGVAVTEAIDGRAALAAIEQASAAGRPFDAVLMDVQMPGMSGHEATREWRRLESQQRSGGSPLPIIALTAAALVSERDEALAAGMNDFLTKPIDAEKLYAALQRWCVRS